MEIPSRVVTASSSWRSAKGVMVFGTSIIQRRMRSTWIRARSEITGMFLWLVESFVHKKDVSFVNLVILSKITGLVLR